jgi:thermostable 8-oxoguanine DNA glycosylase
MIDPSKITVSKATDYELEELILFWICAAGKNGRTAARCLEHLMEDIEGPRWGPMQSVFRATQTRNLPFLLKDNGIGCYMSKARSFLELALAIGSQELNLRTCTTDDLEKIHGIGMKTARCFIIHSRPGARHAGLDTHILKQLRAEGISNVPKSTPGSKKEYERLEREVLKLADKAGLSPADYDLMIWNKYSIKSTPRS